MAAARAAVFEPMRADGGGRGSDEDEAGVFAGRGEIGVLAQESVARMDGFGAVLAGGVQNAVDAQVAFRGGRRADVLGFVGHAHVQRGAVGIGDTRPRVPMPISRSVRMTRTAISPRLAIRTLRNMQREL